MQRRVWLLSGDRFTSIVQCLHAQALLNTQRVHVMDAGLFSFPVCVIKYPVVKKNEGFFFFFLHQGQKRWSSRTRSMEVSEKAFYSSAGTLKRHVFV